MTFVIFVASWLAFDGPAGLPVLFELVGSSLQMTA
jgi:hypothetical protein